MVLILVSGAHAFTVYHQYLHLLAIMLALKALTPHPQALRARVDRRPYSEAAAPLIKNDPIEQERLASPVLAGDGDDANLVFDALQEPSCLFADNVLS